MSIKNGNIEIFSRHKKNQQVKHINQNTTTNNISKYLFRKNKLTSKLFQKSEQSCIFHNIDTFYWKITYAGNYDRLETHEGSLGVSFMIPQLINVQL